MTEKLSEMECEACQIGATPVCPEDYPKLLSNIPDWELIHIDEIPQLKRLYKFKNFKLAMAFANRLGDLCEEENHHAGIFVEWGKVTVTWWSHSIKGLHLNDFIMAAKTDQLT